MEFFLSPHQHVYRIFVLLRPVYEQRDDLPYLLALINSSIAWPKALPIFEKVIALPR
jgi:hypothetical protein